MISGYTSLNTVVAKVYRTLGINYELNLNDITEWAVEALSLIGSFSQYDQISDCLELVNGKAKLPCGFHKLVDITYNNRPLHWATNSAASNYGCSNCQIPVCNDGTCDYTFYLNNSYLITNITEDNSNGICIVYLGMPVDEDGSPLIPDDIYFLKGIEAFIIYQMDYADWRKAKISDKVLAKSEKEWLFYVNSARGSANMPNAAQLNNLKNVWQRLMPNPNAYDRNFIGYNRNERRRLK